MEPALLLRGIFLGAASTVLLLHYIPAFRSRFLAYGARDETSAGHRLGTAKHKPKPSAFIDQLQRLLDHAATYRVPHAWFTHFYVVSICCSIFWAFQIISHGSVFDTIASLSTQIVSKSMTMEQVILTWMLMLAQGIRRLYESLTLTKPSQSKMLIVHWLLGLAFYLSMNVAVWVEGICMWANLFTAGWKLRTTATLPQTRPSFHRLVLKAPSLRTFVAVPIFLIASGIQYDCHAYLASLRKYTLPMHPMFQSLVCPHYFAECLIYLSLALIAGPPGELLNKTILCGLVFVIVNLGVTADMTKKWYAQKFGKEKVKDRWRMVPFAF